MLSESKKRGNQSAIDLMPSKKRSEARKRKTSSMRKARLSNPTPAKPNTSKRSHDVNIIIEHGYHCVPAHCIKYLSRKSLSKLLGNTHSRISFRPLMEKKYQLSDVKDNPDWPLHLKRDIENEINRLIHSARRLRKSNLSEDQIAIIRSRYATAS